MKQKHAQENKGELVRKLIAGAVCGLANGLFGAGGGMVAVPSLERLVKMPPDKAHAGAIFVILPLTVVSAAIYALRGAVAWDALIYVAPSFFVFGAVGAKILGKINAVWLNRMFSLLMAAAAVWMIAA